MDMRAEYSLLSEPAFAPAVSLKSVYYVEADKSYSVHHHPYKTDTAVLPLIFSRATLNSRMTNPAESSRTPDPKPLRNILISSLKEATCRVTVI